MPGKRRIIKNLVNRIFKKQDIKKQIKSMSKLADETVAFSKTPEGKKQTLEFRQRFKGIDITDAEAMSKRQREWLAHQKTIDKLTKKKRMGGAIGPHGIL